jgi:hypothetical protein
MEWNENMIQANLANRPSVKQQSTFKSMVRIGLTTFRVFEFVRKCLCDDLWGS